MFLSKLCVLLAAVPSILAAPVAISTRDDNDVVARGESTSQILRRAAGSSTYNVASGDTGNAIAAAYSITFNTLSNSNPNVNWNALQVGQSLVMPSSRQPIVYTVVSGDTETSIANKYNVFNQDFGGANPSVTWSNLQIGQKLRVPGYGTSTTYTVVSGDTGYAIATAEGISFDTLSAANPGVNWSNLQLGQVLKVPAGTSPSTGTLPSPAPSTSSGKPTATSSSASNKSTATVSSSVKTTATATSATISKSVTTTSATSPATTSAGGQPAISQTASVTGSMAVASVNNNDGVSSRADTYTFYQGDGSSSAGWPQISQWISFNTMWNQLQPYIGQSCQSSWNVANNSPSETQDIYNAIQAVAAKSKVDHRLILATIIQESSGCVRVPTTNYGVNNPGLMQDYNGVGTCNSNGQVSTPCPTSSIYQMIEDGVFGTTTMTSSPAGGLVQDINAQSAGGYSGAQAIYRSSRVYNAGSVPGSNDLGAPGATRCYVSDVANRLMGWVSAAKTCNLS